MITRMRRIFSTDVPFSVLSSSALVALAISGATACSSDRDAMDKRVRSLQDEVTRVQNSADRLEERLAALEIQSLARRASAPDEDRASDPVLRPRLKVVQVVPGASPQSAEAEPEKGAEFRSSSAEPLLEEDEASRPLIRGEGSKLETTNTRDRRSPSEQKQVLPAKSPSLRHNTEGGAERPEAAGRVR